MRNVLSYYYNLTFDEIKEYNDYAILRRDNNIYIFKKFVQDEEEIKTLAQILANNHIPIHTIIINNEQKITTIYHEQPYILLKINEAQNQIDTNFFYLEVSPTNTDLGALWSKQIDYYMQQIHALALGKEMLINSFNYYIGLAENAIQLYNRLKANTEPVKYVIAHRRIHYPNYALNYLDPTNMLIDCRVRDLAEYVKAKFFSSTISYTEVINLLERYDLSNKEVNLFYARLLYPTYYFDLFEDNIIDEKEESSIEQIILKHSDYEQLLFQLYQHLRDYYALPEIYWLKKEL